ncbi:MAG: VOC family protein [Chloroflexi bacterium]|nr:MAG: VOC family protein [Chloroflexota bacterium]TMB76975.1 MAG: VOC family protein [Chloroflexota bacterium]TMB91067.1 MAG: VOC family protein [Chloroflexota bacterium]TMC29438.1 MAG: VOC family protein [Chloroflexota bacterium]TMC34186.1 MAG: VOC family protein [Chloroflexota bacterium]
MAVVGIHHVLVETHNFGKSAKFWQELGWRLVEDHGDSGKLVARGGGAYIWLNEVAPSRKPSVDIYFDVTDSDGFVPKSPVEIVEPFTSTHWGTKVMQVRDPDGRIVTLQAH